MRYSHEAITLCDGGRQAERARNRRYVLSVAVIG
jgi:hypothetical protein